MRRREFITLLGGAVALPFAARAQQGARVRRIGLLITGPESDPLYRAYTTALREGLETLGWTQDRNLHVDARFVGGDSKRVGTYAQELVSLAPELIVCSGALQTRAVQQQTGTIPIVFVNVGDPVASGVVKNIARPEGNTTGVTNLFLSVAGKWVELLKEVAPRVARAALVFNPDFPVSGNYMAAIEAAAATTGVKTTRTPFGSATEIERTIDAFAEPDGGLIVVPPPLAWADRGLILRLALQHRLPVIFDDRLHAVEGALMSYGPDSADLYRHGASSYVDRILRGAKPADLPVQFPTKFELVVNLKTAKAIGLTIPDSFLSRVDEVIE
jgi:putative tryptophan/tyrosine transport system substrate-binding protein